jgi:hypothetical protein
MFPVRELSMRLQVSKPTVFRIRRSDPDYLELVVEYDIGGVTMADEDRLEAYVARKRERAEADKIATAQPLKRKPGRPRKVRAL